MTHYGTLRTWALLLKVVGAMFIISAVVGTVIAAFEADSFVRGLAVFLIGIPISIFLATLPIAIAQMMTAMADMGDAMRQR